MQKIKIYKKTDKIIEYWQKIYFAFFSTNYTFITKLVSIRMVYYLFNLLAMLRVASFGKDKMIQGIKI